MGKKPLIGVVGTLWLGLTLSGCESCGCGQKSTYQAPNGNLRTLVNGSSQQGTQPVGQQTAQTGAQTGTSTTTATATSGQQSWTTPPRSTTAAPSYTGTSTTPSYTGSTPAPMPAGPASSTGSLLPTGGVDPMKSTVPPAVNTTTPVGSTAWPMKPAGDSGLQQTSAIVPPSSDASQPAALPLTSPEPKGSLMSSQRTTDGYGSSSFSDQSSMKMLPPPPPMPRSASLSSSSTLPAAAPAVDANPALMAPPPPPPAGVASSPLPPVGGSTIDVPAPPPVPTGSSVGK
jgi:hypothetical protein